MDARSTSDVDGRAENEERSKLDVTRSDSASPSATRQVHARRASVAHFSPGTCSFRSRLRLARTRPWRAAFSPALEIPRAVARRWSNASSRPAALFRNAVFTSLQSDRTLGYGPGFQLEIPVIPATIRWTQGVLLVVQVAARVSAVLRCEIESQHVFLGTQDGFGAVARAQTAHVTPSYCRGLVKLGEALYPGSEVTDSHCRLSGPGAVILRFRAADRVWDAKGYELGGFALDVLHAYDPGTSHLFRQRHQRTAQSTLWSYSARQGLRLGTPDSVAIAPDGSVI